MTDTRVTKSADQLLIGDWLAPNELHDLATEVLWAESYTSALSDVRHVQLAHRPMGEHGKARVDVVMAGTPFELATPAELPGIREQAERARFIAGLRSFADWVEANRWAPVKRPSGYSQTARLQIDLYGDTEDATAATVAQVREYAERMGVKTDESLDDRTDASTTIGSVSYSVIAWHKDGRPAEPAPEPLADRSGFDYSREADEDTPITGRLIEPHFESGVEPCYVPSSFHAPEVIQEEIARCAASHPGRDCS